MSNEQLTALLGGWGGYPIKTMGRFEAGEKGPTTRWQDKMLDPA